MKKLALLTVFGLIAASAASAQDNRTFLYDAQGRLTASTRITNGPGDYTGYILDNADNRSQRVVRAAPLPAVQNELRPGEVLLPAQTLTSPDGRAILVLQAEGNLVLYGNGVALWGTPTVVGNSMFVGMQTDGNLVIYSPAFTPLWASGTAGAPGAKLVVQNDCNLVIYDGGTPLWATGTSC